MSFTGTLRGIFYNRSRCSLDAFGGIKQELSPQATPEAHASCPMPHAYFIATIATTV